MWTSFPGKSVFLRLSNRFDIAKEQRQISVRNVISRTVTFHSPFFPFVFCMEWETNCIFFIWGSFFNYCVCLFLFSGMIKYKHYLYLFMLTWPEYLAINFFHHVSIWVSSFIYRKVSFLYLAGRDIVLVILNTESELYKQ